MNGPDEDAASRRSDPNGGRFEAQGLPAQGCLGAALAAPCNAPAAAQADVLREHLESLWNRCAPSRLELGEDSNCVPDGLTLRDRGALEGVGQSDAREMCSSEQLRRRVQLIE
jgi:hypothetical protein